MTDRPTVTGRMSDEELVAAFTGGSEDAYTILVGRYKDPLVNFAGRMLGDFDAALDVVQETFIRVHAKAHTYRPVAKFSTWIYTIAANLARSEIRRRRWGSLVRLQAGEGEGERRPVDPADTAERPDAAAQRAITAEHVDRALRSLPDAQREVVVLFYLQEMTYEEICGILGVRMGTVKSRLNRARAALEAALRPMLDDDEIV